jgi:hypothetical protein
LYGLAERSQNAQSFQCRRVTPLEMTGSAANGSVLVAPRS